MAKIFLNATLTLEMLNLMSVCSFPPLKKCENGEYPYPPG